MIWSLIRIIIIMGVIGGIVYLAHFLMDSSGGVQITVAGYEITLGALQSVVLLALLMLATWLILRLVGLLVAVLRFLNGDETAITRYFTRNRERRAFKALTEAILALGAGDGSLAMRRAQKAERLMTDPTMAQVLKAQAAEISGELSKTKTLYKSLAQKDATKFVGVRGLLKLKLAEDDRETALALAQKAFSLQPKNTEVQDILFDLQAKAKDWSGARATLGSKLKSGSLPRDVYKRRDAVLALSKAKGLLDEEATIEMQEAAIEANRLSPDLAPAAALVADGYIQQNNKRYADRVLKKAWKLAPHPDLAAAFARIEPEETPKERLKRFEKLFRNNNEHRESQVMRAELLVAVEDFPAARKAISALVESDPDARVLTLMAAIERGEGASDTVVRGWLAKALTASRGPQWICDNCASIHAQWASVCSHCNAFDTLSWKIPPQGNIAHLDQTLIPLLAASPERSADEAVVVEEEEEALASAVPEPPIEIEAPKEPAENAVESAEASQEDMPPPEGEKDELEPTKPNS